jgi:hypothetical protein
LWISGGYAPTDSYTNFDGSRDVVYTYTPGADADWIEIRQDGTFTWRYLGQDVDGYWGIGDFGTIKLYGGPFADWGAPWTMEKKSEAEAVIARLRTRLVFFICSGPPAVLTRHLADLADKCGAFPDGTMLRRVLIKRTAPKRTTLG